MSTETKQKAGRKYSVNSRGITSLKKDFVVIQDSVMSADGETMSFTGVPAIGTAHPTHTNLFVSSYDVTEGSGTDKKTLIVTVNYELREDETIGSGQSAVVCAVDEWGWDDSTDEKELTQGVDGTQVLNSAGDPFDSVPKVSVPSPVFTKIMRFAERQTGWAGSVCCVNGAAVTISGITFPIGSLLCSVSERRIIGDAIWKYRYTVKLRYKSNLVKINGGNVATDIGWDCAVVDAGMRALDGVGGKKKLIRTVDAETGRLCTVTSPALLNGQGAALGAAGAPYIFRFQAYQRANFPSWFYSEPSVESDGEDDE